MATSNLNAPNFSTTASVTGATLISQTDEEIRQLMTDVKSYQDNLAILVDTYTADEIASGLAQLDADVQAKINELLSVNPDGTYYTKTAIDTKIQAVDDKHTEQTLLMNRVEFKKSGYTTKVEPKDRWLETDTPNVIVDQVGDDYVIDGVVYSKSTTVSATLPDAPFSGTTSTIGTSSTLYSNGDVLLNDKDDGINVPTAVSKGDIVVTGNELVSGDDSTFDTSVGNWFNGARATLTVDTGRLKVTTNDDSATYSMAGLTLNLVAGMEYVWSFDYELGTHPSIGVQIYNNSAITNLKVVSSSSGRESVTFTPNGTGVTTLYFKCNETAINQYSYFDNISVRLKDKVYQATEDIPTGTSLTDSRFQKLDFASRQDLVYLTSTGYKSMKGIHNFLDKDLVEGGNDLIASTYGWSKTGNNEYEINGEKATCLALVPRLNG